MLRPAVLALLFVAGTAALASADPIGSLHCNDTDGAPRMKGQSVTVSGVVVGQFSTQRNVRLFVQDATGGVCVYGSPKDCAALGDSVSATGVVTGYSGLVEITGTADKPVAIEHLGHASGQPAPLPLTLAAVLATEQSDGCEPDEGRLVEVDGVRLLSAGGEPLAAGAKFGDDISYRMVGADTSVFVILRVTDPEGCDLSQSLEGQPIPTGPMRVTGVLSQYSGRSTTHGGYQVMPRARADVQPIDGHAAAAVKNEPDAKGKPAGKGKTAAPAKH